MDDQNMTMNCVKSITGIQCKVYKILDKVMVC